MCNELKEKLEGFQKTIFKTVTPIIFHDKQSRTDGIFIYLRRPTTLDKKSIELAYASMIHEKLHIIYNSPYLYGLLTKKKQYQPPYYVTPFFKSIYNTIDDYRVEKLGLLEFPGPTMLLHRIMQDRIKNNDILIMDVGLVLLCELNNYEYEPCGVRELPNLKEAVDLASTAPWIKEDNLINLTREVVKLLEE